MPADRSAPDLPPALAHFARRPAAPRLRQIADFEYARRACLSKAQVSGSRSERGAGRLRPKSVSGTLDRTVPACAPSIFRLEAARSSSSSAPQSESGFGSDSPVGGRSKVQCGGSRAMSPAFSSTNRCTRPCSSGWPGRPLNRQRRQPRAASRISARKRGGPPAEPADLPDHERPSGARTSARDFMDAPLAVGYRSLRIGANGGKSCAGPALRRFSGIQMPLRSSASLRRKKRQLPNQAGASRCTRPFPRRQDDFHFFPD